MRSSIWTIVIAVLIVCGSIVFPTWRICNADSVSDPNKESTDFTQFSLEELKNVVIVSVSKKPEMVSDVAAAVYVITQEDIRRSGATSIPEALRLAPGIHVAQISATDWAINIRGLNGKFAKNLLVMIDGRSVYTHVFSGVFWDIQDTVIEDIDRIEVIRGPGAAIWGSNAVNGVINIITQKAKQTQGKQVVVLGGSKEQLASVRHGGTLDNQAYFRLYAKGFNRGDLSAVGLSDSNTSGDPNTAQYSDNWRSGRGGFRVDMEPGHGLPDTSPDSVTVQGEIYSNRYDKEFERSSIIFPGSSSTYTGQTDTSEAFGWHLLGRWQHSHASDSESIFTLYNDYAQKEYDPASGRVNTTVLDFQHRFTAATRHEMVWGLEYKLISDEFNESTTVAMEPSHLNQSQGSAFFQDAITIVPKLLTLTAGSRFEYNEFTGPEIQPSIRALYSPQDRFSIWAAVSRAVRVPSRLEFHGLASDLIQLTSSGTEAPVEVTTHGSSDLLSEKLTAYELGVRLKPAPTLWIDTALFFNDYDQLIGLELRDSDASANQYTLAYANNTSGEAYGLEVVVDWRAAANFLIGASYTYLHTQIQTNQIEDPNIAALIFEESNPRHSFSIHSNLDITPKIDLDLWLRYVGALPEKQIDSYIDLNARLAWRPYPKVELSLMGQNLLESKHPEFSALEVERSIYAKIDWKF